MQPLITGIAQPWLWRESINNNAGCCVEATFVMKRTGGKDGPGWFLLDFSLGKVMC